MEVFSINDPDPLLSCEKVSLSDYEIQEEIGQGGEGKVNKIQNKITREFFALKEITNLGEDQIESQTNILKKITSHKGVLKDVECFPDKNKNKLSIIYQLMDMNLEDYLQEEEIKNNGKLEEDVANNLISTLIDGLSYLKTNGIAHRDIKPENVLIKFQNNNKPEFFLSDFGCSKIIQPPLISKIHSVKGTLPYFSPELRNNHEREHHPINPYKSDIFSLGLLLLRSLSLQSKSIEGLNQPNGDKKKSELLNDIRGKYGYVVANGIEEMLQWEPNNRITLEELPDFMQTGSYSSCVRLKKFWRNYLGRILIVFLLFCIFLLFIGCLIFLIWILIGKPPPPLSLKTSLESESHVITVSAILNENGYVYTRLPPKFKIIFFFRKCHEFNPRGCELINLVVFWLIP